MRKQWLRAGVVGICCLAASAMICEQAMAADLSEAQYIKKRVKLPPSPRAELQRAKQNGEAAQTRRRPPWAPRRPVSARSSPGTARTAEIIVVSYINSADNLGPAVMNLKTGDRVEVMEIDGLCLIQQWPGQGGRKHRRLAGGGRRSRRRELGRVGVELRRVGVELRWVGVEPRRVGVEARRVGVELRRVGGRAASSPRRTSSPSKHSARRSSRDNVMATGMTRAGR